jgi:SPP1 family predicted phage head-tail adaptor
MTTGQLRERVGLQTKTTAPDSQGGRVPTWATHVTVRARVGSDGGSSEDVTVEQLVATVAYTVTLRYRTTVAAGHRVVWKGQTLQIHSVTHDERRRWTVLRCSQVQA